jgi:hypothetical protein
MCSARDNKNIEVSKRHPKNGGEKKAEQRGKGGWDNEPQPKATLTELPMTGGGADFVLIILGEARVVMPPGFGVETMVSVMFGGRGRNL